jgi:NDP-sugar pyrophosphorylase family protein
MSPEAGELLYPVAILAGGLATRLRPLTEKIPKAMIEIAGEPFIARQLRLLASQGARRVVLCAGYLGEMIRDFVGDGAAFGVQVAFSIDGEKLLGTAGALKRALPLLGDRFFTLYGDSYLTCDFAAVQRRFEASGLDALMTVYHNEGQWDASNVEFAEGRIQAYDKRNRTPRMKHIDYGLGVFRSVFFDAVSGSESTDLADVYRRALQAGRLAGHEVPERFYEIGSTAGIAELEALFSGSTGTHS